MRTHSSLAQRVRPFLKSHTFFGGLPDPALDALIERGHTKTFAKGDVIYRRGEPGDSLMVILSGRIKVTNVSASAKEVVLNFLGAGDINGEIAALDGKERSADAVALESCEIFAVHARDLVPTLTAHPEALLEIIQLLCEKLRSASAIIEDSTLEMRGRTAKGLLNLARQHGRPGTDGTSLRVTISQEELGNYLWLSRANVNRQLAQLKLAGLIRISGTEITILDETGLSAVAAETAAKE
jgi:CRP/FNR family transcriptional regulator, cyclic AMP receptor protein